MRVDCFALFTWFALAALFAGIVKTATTHATSAKHLVNRDWSVFECSDANVVSQISIFLILIVRDNKRSSGIDGKTNGCPENVCIIVMFGGVSAIVLFSVSFRPVIFVFSLISAW